MRNKQRGLHWGTPSCKDGKDGKVGGQGFHQEAKTLRNSCRQNKKHRKKKLKADRHFSSLADPDLRSGAF